MVQALKLKMKEQKGFTLIELLAVIVILGIIAAIAIPAISNVINKSEAKSQAQEGVQIINAAKMYVANERIVLSDDDVIDVDSVLLGEYLDRVDVSGAQVVVQETAASSGKFTYTLTNHPAVVSGSAIDEDTLIENAK
jgi:type IV pilus assembly protein PilA